MHHLDKAQKTTIPDLSVPADFRTEKNFLTRYNRTNGQFTELNAT
jgi:hypothetical protein